jgi:hypothetical protein
VGDRVGAGQVQKQGVEGNDPHRGHRLVYEGEWWHVHSTHAYLPVKMEETERSETSEYKLQMPGNYPKESIQQLHNILLP